MLCGGPRLISFSDSDDDDNSFSLSKNYMSPTTTATNATTRPASCTTSRKMATPSFSPEFGAGFLPPRSSQPSFSDTGVMHDAAHDEDLGYADTDAWMHSNYGSICRPPPIWAPLAPASFRRTVMHSSDAVLPGSLALAPPAVPPRPTFRLPQRLNCSFHQHLGGRKSQEDMPHFGMLPDVGGTETFVAALYDGHKGTQASELASTRLPEFLPNAPTFHTDLELAMVDSLRALDVQMLAEDAACGSGTTALVVCVRDRLLTVANLGDCRALLVTTSGGHLQLTEEHKPESESEKARREQLPSNDPVYVDTGLSVSRGIGDFELKTVEGVHSGACGLSNVAEVSSVALDDECAAVVLVSDGIWGVVRNEEIAAIVGQHLRVPGDGDDGDDLLLVAGPSTPRAASDEVARDVVNLALGRNPQDNITAVVMTLR